MALTPGKTSSMVNATVFWLIFVMEAYGLWWVKFVIILLSPRYPRGRDRTQIAFTRMALLANLNLKIKDLV